MAAHQFFECEKFARCALARTNHGALGTEHASLDMNCMEVPGFQELGHRRIWGVIEAQHPTG